MYPMLSPSPPCGCGMWLFLWLKVSPLAVQRTILGNCFSSNPSRSSSSLQIKVYFYQGNMFLHLKGHCQYPFQSNDRLFIQWPCKVGREHSWTMVRPNPSRHPPKDLGFRRKGKKQTKTIIQTNLMPRLCASLDKPLACNMCKRIVRRLLSLLASDWACHKACHNSTVSRTIQVNKTYMSHKSWATYVTASNKTTGMQLRFVSHPNYQAVSLLKVTRIFKTFSTQEVQLDPKDGSGSNVGVLKIRFCTFVKFTFLQEGCKA